ncbi:MAG TPA: cell division protein FtsQ/DivIB [Arenimonas sp.]|nr:cell division protein FtsQ/DivIB [Arenimonas sp.]
MNGLLRLAVWLLAIAMVTLPIVAVLSGWIGTERWPLRQLVLTGEFQLVEDARVREAVLPQAGRGFFAVDLREVRDAVAALPWVATVQVRKRWPDRIEIQVGEHRPVARWGESRMLAEGGELFPAVPGRGAGLPLFEAPDDRAGEVVVFHREAQAAVAPLGLAIAEVRLSPRASWSLVLDDGLELELGRDEALPRLQRFAALLPALRAESAKALQRVDLRYTNGFAVVHQDPPAMPPPPAVQASS